jgi:hypothetical protein
MSQDDETGTGVPGDSFASQTGPLQTAEPALSDRRSRPPPGQTLATPITTLFFLFKKSIKRRRLSLAASASRALDEQWS